MVQIIYRKYLGQYLDLGMCTINGGHQLYLTVTISWADKYFETFSMHGEKDNRNGNFSW